MGTGTRAFTKLYNNPQLFYEDGDKLLGTMITSFPTIDHFVYQTFT